MEIGFSKVAVSGRTKADIILYRDTIGTVKIDPPESGVPYSVSPDDHPLGTGPHLVGMYRVPAWCQVMAQIFKLSILGVT